MTATASLRPSPSRTSTRRRTGLQVVPRSTRVSADHPPSDADLTQLARVAREHARRDDHETARLLYASLVALRPRELSYRLGLSLAFDQLGQLDEAMTEYRAAIRFAPDDPAPLVHLAELALDKADRDQARKLLRRALGLMRRGFPPGEERLRVKAEALMRFHASAFARRGARPA